MPSIPGPNKGWVMKANTSPLAQVSFLCPSCSLPFLEKSQKGLECTRCPFTAACSGAFFDFLGSTTSATDEHYTLQWGQEKGFFDFLRRNPAAKSIMPAGQMGWPRLFQEI